jgi:cyanophycin synthetase
VTFFGPNEHHPVIATHRALGKRVVFVDDGHIVAAEGTFQVRIPMSQIPFTRNGTIGFQVDNAMAAIGAAWALDVPWNTVLQGLFTFVSDAHAVPGRFNLFDYKGATVIADYGHNPDAIQALSDAVQQMPARERMVVISGAGDRRDEDIRDQTRILGKVFDEVILYQDACQRGREDGEVIGLLREGLEGATKTQRISEIRGEFNAIDTALERLQPGDLCLILIDQVQEALDHIAARVRAANPVSA